MTVVLGRFASMCALNLVISIYSSSSLLLKNPYCPVAFVLWSSSYSLIHTGVLLWAELCPLKIHMLKPIP